MEQCSSAAFPSDYITCHGAGVDLPSSRAQQPSVAALSTASLIEQQSSSPVECVLHNTITNTLTAVRTVNILSKCASWKTYRDSTRLPFG